MKKTIIALTRSLVCTLLIGSPAISFANNVSNTIDNGKIENGRMLIPLRAVSERFNSEVTWNQAKKALRLFVANES
ncbi:stalk domain-containing protein [Paenibacillus sp. FSL W7-1332]|uniref:stalk domain-containing protein n=1 Tax=Paenibacillus sp. FSL W7-1332 TaxID=2921702 RepID=UPI0030D0FD47